MKYELCIFATESRMYISGGRFESIDKALVAARRDANNRNIFSIESALPHFIEYMSREYNKQFVAGLTARFYQVMIAEVNK